MWEDLIREKFNRYDLTGVRWLALMPDFLYDLGLATDEQVIDRLGVDDNEHVIARIRAAKPGDWIAAKEAVFVRLGTLID